MKNPFSRRPVPSRKFGPADLRKFRGHREQVGDTLAVLLVDRLIEAEGQRSDDIYAIRHNIVAALKEGQGDYGPSEWGKGYFEAFEDAMQIVREQTEGVDVAGG